MQISNGPAFRGDARPAASSCRWPSNSFAAASCRLSLRRSGGKGRIINISSLLGLIPSPYNAIYSASKHAIEGYSESLDHELRTFGIRVALVEPAYTNTAFEENKTKSDQPLSIYDAMRAQTEKFMMRSVKDGDAPETVAELPLSQKIFNAILHGAG